MSLGLWEFFWNIDNTHVPAAADWGLTSPVPPPRQDFVLSARDLKAPFVVITDWSNPRGDRRPDYNIPQSNIALIGVAVQDPFKPVSFPNPRGPDHQKVRVDLNFLPLTVNNVYMPAAGDWGLPTLGIVPAITWTSPSLALSSGAVQDPFRQRDWPNPTLGIVTRERGWVSNPDLSLYLIRVPREALITKFQPIVDRQGFLQSSAEVLLTTAQVLPTIRITPWDNPRGPVHQIVRVDQNILPLTVPNVYMPASQDWGNPTLLVPAAITWLSPSLALSSVVQVQDPFKPFIWENPRAVLSRQDYLQGANELLLNVPFYFKEIDWSNPVIIRINPSYVASSPEILLTTPQALPVAHYETPNPRLQIISLKDYISGSPVVLLTFVPPLVTEQHNLPFFVTMGQLKSF